MNRRIAELATQPRGRKWRSRLIKFDEVIRRMRKDLESYKAIAIWISDHGLAITGSAVHAYVRARARQRRDLYCLPSPSATHFFIQSSPSALAHEDKLNVPRVQIEEHESVVSKRFVFSPSTEVEKRFDDKKLTFNDPLDPSHEYE